MPKLVVFRCVLMVSLGGDTQALPAYLAGCFRLFTGALGRNRTCGQKIRSLLLYPLSYEGFPPQFTTAVTSSFSDEAALRELPGAMRAINAEVAEVRAHCSYTGSHEE